ncbi:hypothetical protein ESA94_13680 [Lacibacter luteus]|uniref:Lipoprotein n=1 Tax=Lacibacter luteus TaxID=2508719 RepID=A0A4Q1CH09_9BACT|nr:hypothetical protein [Lacibacter luteus]RXK59186.1 hypothetical protein ESA94_13680 [Lacibacter luteus]
MKLKHSILFVLLTLLGCKQTATDLHNGEYVSSEEHSKQALEESIIIKGNKATLRMRSLFNRSKLTKSTYLCLHYPDRVDLHFSKRRPISIPVNKDGNLIWDEKVFIKQIPLIIQPMPIPEAFLEAME